MSGKLQWYRRNKTLMAVLLHENKQLHGGNSGSASSQLSVVFEDGFSQVFKTPGSCSGSGCSLPPLCQTRFRTAARSAPCPPFSFYLSVKRPGTVISPLVHSLSSSSSSSPCDHTVATEVAVWLERRCRGPRCSTFAVQGNP